MKMIILIFTAVFSFNITSAQNVGIGIPVPLEKLDVNGNVKANGLVLTTGGSQYDFLMKNNSSGQVGFKKGHGALAIHYIIAVNGSYPLPTGAPVYNVTMVGEIKIFAGNYPPSGWEFCNGQLLNIETYETLFSLLGTTYGGNGQTNFALPDLRGAVPVSPGVSPAGYEWIHAEKSN